jgi:hypothetical protein
MKTIINSGKFAMTVVMLSVFVAMVGIASQYPPDARFMPLIVGIPAIALCLLRLGLDFRDALRSKAPAPAAHDERTVRREMIMWAYFIGLVGGLLLFGFLLAIPVFVVVFLRHWAQTSWRFALGLTATASVILYTVFVRVLGVALHPGFVTGYVLDRFSG